ncbi:hypothetical protein BDP81DRAFT_125343 [Colletotrichum phormii]|uniref:Uncharacterized protein n=1 Tax=Colletotrichum phormii TaxID=359342 RepID=A0AAI9ZZ90_9PEZI|nr:uncharacterized protein BDP81DRAFT_125343 [Colletotrichum phormii]KAK1640969.1 hypothetical protein BDP81DRAFT_125343 [Colletotrichum phormii]
MLGSEERSRWSREIIRWVPSGWRCPASHQFAHPPPPLFPRGYLVRGFCNFFSRFCRQSGCGVASVILQPHVCWEGLSRTVGFFLPLFVRWGSTLRAWRAPAFSVHDATETDNFSIEQARDLMRVEISQAGISVRGSGEETFTATFDMASLDSANTKVIYTDISARVMVR